MRHKLDSQTRVFAYRRPAMLVACLAALGLVEARPARAVVIGKGDTRPQGPVHSGHLGDCVYAENTDIVDMQAVGTFDPLLARLKTLCKAWPDTRITVFSGYRTPKHNASVNGARDSRHVEADAFDFRVNKPGPEVREKLSTFPGGRGAYGDSTFHIDLGANRCWANMRTQCKESVAIDENYDKRIAAIRDRDRQQGATGRPVIPTGGDHSHGHPHAHPPDPIAARTHAFLTDRIDDANGGVGASGIPRPPAGGGGSAPSDFVAAGSNAMGSIGGAAGPAAGGAQSPAAVDGRAVASGGAGSGTAGIFSSGRGGAPAGSAAIAASTTGDAAYDAARARGPVNTDLGPVPRPTSPPPRLCAVPARLPARYCEDNYKLSIEANECLFRVREAKLISGQVMQEKSVKGHVSQQNLNQRDAAHDHRVAGALASRYTMLLQQALSDLRGYSTRMTMPEDSSPASEPCWAKPQSEIQRAIAELERELNGSQSIGRSAASVETETTKSQIQLGTHGDEMEPDADKAVEDFDKRVIDLE